MPQATEPNKTIFSNIIIIGGGARCEILLPLLVKYSNYHITAIIENNCDSHQKIRVQLDQLGAEETLIFESLTSFSESSLSGKLQAIPGDVAFILTPEWTHVNIFEELIKADYNIFIEKPLATIEEDVLKIQKLAMKTDRVVQVGFVLRYTSFYQIIKDAVASGKLGTLVMIEMSERLLPISGASNRRRWHRLKKNTGGFLNEKSSHDLDVMCWLKENQGKPIKVFSHGGQHFFNRHEMPLNCGVCNDMGCIYRFKGDINQNSYNAEGKIPTDTCVYNSDADIMDNQSVIISFSDGTQGIFTLLNVSGVDGREIRIHGTKGMLYGSSNYNKITIHEYRNNKKQELPIPDCESGHYGGDAAIIDEFFHCVKSGKQSNSTISDGVQASLLAFAADKSVIDKNVINLNSREIQ